MVAWYFLIGVKPEKFACGHTYTAEEGDPSLAAKDDPYSYLGIHGKVRIKSVRSI